MAVTIAIVISITTIFGSVGGTATQSGYKDDLDGQRLYISDDEEVGTLPPFLVPYLSEVVKVKHERLWAVGGVNSEEYTAEKYALYGDYYYAYSRPPVAIGDEDSGSLEHGQNGVVFFWFDHPVVHRVAELGWGVQTVTSLRIEQASQIRDTDTTEAVYVGDEQDGTDTEYIEDAHTDILGVNGGAELQLSGQPEIMLIDDSGQVLTHSDFRVEPPDEMGNGHCESGRDRDDVRVCSVDVNVISDVFREVQIANQTWNARLNLNSPGDVFSPSRVTQYSGVEEENRTQLTARTQIFVTLVEWKQLQVKVGERWVPTTVYLEYHRDNVTVSESRDVVVTTNQDLTVRQRVIEGPDETIVVAEFHGPANITERQLWSTLSFGQYTVQSGWGMYSHREHTSGVLTTNDDKSSTIDIPDQLGMKLTARQDSPRIRERIYPGHGAVEIGLYAVDMRDFSPRVGQSVTFEFSSSGVNLDDDLDLDTSRAVGYNAIVFRNAPNRIQGIRSIHGNEIPFQTTNHEYHPTTIEADVIDENTARFTLIDAATDQPISGKELKISNGKRETARTNSDGEVVVERAGNPITVAFDETDLLERHDVYYGATNARLVMPLRFHVGAVGAEIIRGILAIITLILLYVPVRYIQNGRDG